MMEKIFRLTHCQATKKNENFRVNMADEKKFERTKSPLIPSNQRVIHFQAFSSPQGTQILPFLAPGQGFPAGESSGK